MFLRPRASKLTDVLFSDPMLVLSGLVADVVVQPQGREGRHPDSRTPARRRHDPRRQRAPRRRPRADHRAADRDRQRFAPVVGRSEEHTSELQSLMRISSAVFRLKNKLTKNIYTHIT